MTEDLPRIVTTLVWQEAIKYLRRLAKQENFAAMSGPDALTEAAAAMEMAIKAPEFDA